TQRARRRCPTAVAGLPWQSRLTAACRVTIAGRANRASGGNSPSVRFVHFHIHLFDSNGATKLSWGLSAMRIQTPDLAQTELLQLKAGGGLDEAQRERLADLYEANFTAVFTVCR